MTLAVDASIHHPRTHWGNTSAVVLLIASLGCGGATDGDEGRASLRVAAASDLRDACPRLSERFEEKTGIKVTPSFGASGQLAAQIAQGAPFDLFLAANQSFVDDLVAHGLIEPDSVRPYARGSLVLAVYRDFAGQLGSLEDLTKPIVKKIALANPDTAPYGKAGKEALERAGLFKQLEPKIVLAESVGQAMIYVQKGDVEAALIGRAIARRSEIRVVAIDADLYAPIIQALGILTSSKRTAEARAFAEFVLGEDGQSMLAEFGLANSHE
jgi:molybdate transport system substrate-binding protein